MLFTEVYKGINQTHFKYVPNDNVLKFIAPKHTRGKSTSKGRAMKRHSKRRPSRVFYLNFVIFVFKVEILLKR